jgi:methylmalonyl-CoA mutase N-terminal domain/subunit
LRALVNGRHDTGSYNDQRSKIQEESMHYEMQKHTGEYPIISVNTLRNPHNDAAPESIELTCLQDSHTRHAATAPATAGPGSGRAGSW